ncbi:hypothetical protein AJ80_08396 [Polytolypa hystricis UAMH7299]|uniref:Uncharacterized protein n=1 Tax=Polytolypa hystricis (strain UAMH7299) TaxID=1447883 RepID=A0A2B7X8G0_POLH7|nr:hypothetical protein AJ80_08396 [Polytolypa hystricis UAMH7299]
MASQSYWYQPPTMPTGYTNPFPLSTMEGPVPSSTASLHKARSNRIYKTVSAGNSPNKLIMRRERRDTLAQRNPSARHSMLEGAFNVALASSAASQWNITAPSQAQQQHMPSTATTTTCASTQPAPNLQQYYPPAMMSWQDTSSQFSNSNNPAMIPQQPSYSFDQISALQQQQQRYLQHNNNAMQSLYTSTPQQYSYLDTYYSSLNAYNHSATASVEPSPACLLPMHHSPAQQHGMDYPHGGYTLSSPDDDIYGGASMLHSAMSTPDMLPLPQFPLEPKTPPAAPADTMTSSSSDELVGVGLYDEPDALLLWDQPGGTDCLGSLGGGMDDSIILQNPARKGLKLEETFDPTENPPQSDSEDAEADEEESQDASEKKGWADC